MSSIHASAHHTIFETRHVAGHGFSFDAPVLASIDPWALALSAAAILAIFRLKTGMIPTLAACSAASGVLYLLGVIS